MVTMIRVSLWVHSISSLCGLDSRLEGWISLPTKNTKRFGWDKKVNHCSFTPSVDPFLLVCYLPLTLASFTVSSC